MAADPRDDRIAELEAIVARQQKIIERLEARLAELEARLAQNSSNSNQPPSQDTPAQKNAQPGKTPTGRKRGGQPGHRGNRRELLPLSEVDRVEDCFPAHCNHCGDVLEGVVDEDPLRHQVMELPPIKPYTTEYRRHAEICGGCGHVTRAELPPGVPRSMLGARLTALVSLLTGGYHLSRRQASALLGEVLGIRISLGALSEAEERASTAVAPAVDEAISFVRSQPLKHTDATGWSHGGQPRGLWTITTSLVTVFLIVADGTQQTVRSVLGRVRGWLVSDRAKQFLFWAMSKRQICWAHLIRKFTSFTDRAGAAGAIGRELRQLAELLFHYWHRVRDGTMSRAEFRRNVAPIRVRVEELLRRGQRLRVRGVSGSCADILEHQPALWAFVDHKGIEPTNNLAERDLRPFVLWRKRSYGSQSERGERYAERIMTVVHTLRKQQRPVLDYLHAACAAALNNEPPPSLLPSYG